MKTVVILVALTLLALIHAKEVTSRRKKPRRPKEPPMGGDESLNDLKKEVKHLKTHLSHISRQLMLQQFFTEEKIRNDGFSGIKQVRTGLG